jgi:hypothetical protein
MTSHKGFFKPKHPEKYKGDPTNIVWRSTWELKYMMQLDHDPLVLEWSSESVVVPYVSPKDNKLHRYFPDFKVKRSDGTYIIEIKPLKDMITPINKGQRGYLKQLMTVAVNKRKFESAKRWCESRQYTFKLLTERELNIPGY